MPVKIETFGLLFSIIKIWPLKHSELRYQNTIQTVIWCENCAAINAALTESESSKKSISNSE